MSDLFERNEEERVSYSPAETLEVNLSSCGKLSAPPTIRVTDYDMEDTLKLSTATPSNIVKLLVEVLQRKVQEDFDVRLLHENEFEEILFTVFVNFWNRFFLDYPFPWTEEDLEAVDPTEAQRIRDGKKELKTDIDLTSVQVDEIDENFQEPIVIDINGKKVGMRLARVGDFLLVEEEVKKKFAVMDKRFSDLKYMVEQGQNIKEIAGERLIPYLEYEKERSIYFLSLKQAILLQFVEENGGRRVLTTMEEKFHEYKHLSKKYWIAYREVAEKVNFGINHDVKMKSPLTGETVTRRCLFQVLDYLPPDDLSDDTGYSVQFGD